MYIHKVHFLSHVEQTTDHGQNSNGTITEQSIRSLGVDGQEKLPDDQH
jgi:hypothetical protein